MKVGLLVHARVVAVVVLDSVSHRDPDTVGTLGADHSHRQQRAVVVGFALCVLILVSKGWKRWAWTGSKRAPSWRLRGQRCLRPRPCGLWCAIKVN